MQPNKLSPIDLSSALSSDNYRVLPLGPNPSEAADRLNQAWSQGWELVCVSKNTAYLKRLASSYSYFAPQVSSVPGFTGYVSPPIGDVRISG